MKLLLEKYLTRIPMYMLVGLTLALLIATALAQSAMGNLAFSPLELVASATVFSLTGTGSSYLFGKLYGVPSHLRSAGITALILTLIFTPSLDIGVLLQYALISIIAQASKYIITWHKRHIFNPAAFGALLGGLLGLQYATWWVSTPALFVPLVICAFLVLYKTRLVPIGAAFVALGAVLVALLGLIDGNGFRDTLVATLVSWPLIFIAGFMLTEPLTLPPRNWQRYTVAGLVAVLVALPFSFVSPELALVLGNLLAFIFAFRQRASLSLVLKERRPLTPTADEFVFRTNQPVVFEAGQYIDLMLPHHRQDMRGVRRSFSVTSTPGEPEVRVGVKFYEPSSSFKKQLRKLAPGDIVHSTGITGDFVLPTDKREKLLFIAGGIGITPFISHILSTADEGRDITLLYFIRNPEEAAYKDILDNSAVDVHYFVADQPGELFLEGSRLNDDILKTWVTGLGRRHAFISGPPAMVAGAKQLLKGKVKKIHTDYFSGY